MAPNTSDVDPFDGDRPSEPRVSQYLDCLEVKEKRARRGRYVALGVGALLGGVAYLTSIGVAPTEARDLVASAGALVAGLTFAKP